MAAVRRLPLLALALLLALVLAACGGSDDQDTSPETVQGETPTAETETGDGEGDGGEGDAEAGASLFGEQGCGSCHTLADAGSTGTTGPNLDEAQPSFDAAFEQIENGGGVMPAYGEQLDDEQIANLAAYVSERAGG
jgi:mono/diheme cytochrome c family protein